MGKALANGETDDPDGALALAHLQEVHSPPTAGLTIGELAREVGISLRALRFYQSRGLLMPSRNGSGRVFSCEDRERLAFILKGKRLGFTLSEIREMLARRPAGSSDLLPITREKCVEQINLLERQKRELDVALSELRHIYTGMYLSAAPVLQAAKNPRRKSRPTGLGDPS